MKEKCWSIKDNFPIKLFYKKDWTGRIYNIYPYIGTMSYKTWESLSSRHLTDIIKVCGSFYNYENGDCQFLAYTVDDIKAWAENYKNEVLVFPEEERKKHSQIELNFS